MNAPKNLAVVALAALLVVCLLAYYSTRDSATPSPPRRAPELYVDRGLLVTAIQLLNSVPPEAPERLSNSLAKCLR